MYAGYLNDEQQRAHHRMLAYLPVRSHLKLDEDKFTPKRPRHRDIKPIYLRGKMYPSVTVAMTMTGLGLRTIQRMLQKGLARYIHEQPSVGTQTFNVSTTSAPSKAALRRREREAAK